MEQALGLIRSANTRLQQVQAGNWLGSIPPQAMLTLLPNLPQEVLELVVTVCTTVPHEHCALVQKELERRSSTYPVSSTFVSGAVTGATGSGANGKTEWLADKTPLTVVELWDTRYLSTCNVDVAYEEFSSIYAGNYAFFFVKDGELVGEFWHDADDNLYSFLEPQSEIRLVDRDLLSLLERVMSMGYCALVGTEDENGWMLLHQTDEPRGLFTRVRWGFDDRKDCANEVDIPIDAWDLFMVFDGQRRWCFDATEFATLWKKANREGNPLVNPYTGRLIPQTDLEYFRQRFPAHYEDIVRHGNEPASPRYEREHPSSPSYQERIDVSSPSYQERIDVSSPPHDPEMVMESYLSAARRLLPETYFPEIEEEDWSPIGMAGREPEESWSAEPSPEVPLRRKRPSSPAEQRAKMARRQ